MKCEYSFDPSVETGEGLDTTWNCPHEALNEETRKCIFHLSEEQREKHNVTKSDILAKIKENLDNKPELNEYIGANLPSLSLTYDILEGDKNHVLNLKYAKIESLNFSHSTIKQGVKLDQAEIGDLKLIESRIEGRLIAKNLTVKGKFVGKEAVFLEEAHFDECRFEGMVEFSESDFRQDMSFQRSIFEEKSDFRNIHTTGNSHELGDHANFSKCRFKSQVLFAESQLEYVTFAETVFEDEADFNHVRFDGDAFFDNAKFKSVANFNDTTCEEDASFEEARFRGKTVFKGSKFKGGSRATEDDLSFKKAVFKDEADFQKSEFNYTNFSKAVFQKKAVFEEVVFDKDADFHEMNFEAEADFDEARFNEDADFHETVFKGKALFRGSIFKGEAEHIEENALFRDTVFKKEAYFQNSKFTSVNFENARFGDECNFSESIFEEEVHFQIKAGDNDIYVNLTDSKIVGGSITELADGIVPYDLTRAEVGDIRLEGEGLKHELLDYFRFCLTDLNGFDFSNHHTYLERNNWDIHSFVDNNADVQTRVEMNNEVIEETYRKAQVNADIIGDKEAKRNFEFKRWYFNRQKNWEMIKEEYSLNTWTRIKKTAGIGLNLFMQYTCGYANKVPRIFATMGFFTFLYGVLYTLGGPFRTGAGVIWRTSNPGKVLFDGIYYSGVTFTTIGYGGIGPQGWAAKILAPSEAYLSAILFTLLTVTLLRSAIGSS